MMRMGEGAIKGNAAWRALSDDEPDGEVDISRMENVLQRSGFFSADRVRAAMRKSETDAIEKWRPDQFDALEPGEARQLAARLTPKNKFGRRGLPLLVIEEMWLDYQRLGSLAKVGKLYRRTRQSMYGILAGRYKLNSRNFNARILWRGEPWTPEKGGYYRPTTGDRTRRLHHEIWMARYGRAIPEGWQVTFKNGDNSDFSFGNLICMPIAEVSLWHYRRRFPERAKMTAANRREMWRTHNREFMREKSRRNIALGLRCDGKPRRRKVLSVA